MKRIIHPTEFDAACRAYWELEHDAWSELPEPMKRKVRARIATALAAIGILIPETPNATAALTDEAIEQLSVAAGAHGDTAMAEICERALYAEDPNERERARTLCAEAIAAANAMA